MVKKLIYCCFIIFIFYFASLNVYADDNSKGLLINTNEEQSNNSINVVIDGAEIFNEGDINLLNKAISEFKERTGYNICIETIESLEGSTINETADFNYLDKFPNNESLYILISENEGDMIIKYGDTASPIITDELIQVMMMSVDAEFQNTNIAAGLCDCLYNGSLLIDENIKLNEDRHEVLTIDESQSTINTISLVLCIIAAGVFIFNLIYLTVSHFKKKG